MKTSDFITGILAAAFMVFLIYQLPAALDKENKFYSTRLAQFDYMEKVNGY